MEKALFVLVFSMIIMSCGPKVIFDSKTKLNTEGWTYKDGIDFGVNISDSTSAYDMILEIGFDPNFSYENVYFLISTDFPESIATQDSVSFQLSDSKGQWNGDCSSSLCSTQFILQHGIYFKELGDYTFGFSQFSRDENLKGMKSLGLKIVEVK